MERDAGERRRELRSDPVEDQEARVPSRPVMEHFFTGTRSAGWLRSNYNFIAEVVEKVAPSVVHLQLFRR